MQVDPQLIRGATLLVTVPEPLPAFATVMVAANAAPDRLALATIKRTARQARRDDLIEVMLNRKKFQAQGLEVSPSDLIAVNRESLNGTAG